MKPFSKTYYTDNLHITIRIKRDELCVMGCRLTIKRKINTKKTYPYTPRGYYSYDFNRILYTSFYNDKNMFREYEREMIETKVPRTIIDEIMTDIKTNLMFEKVVTYQPITNKMPPFTKF